MSQKDTSSKIKAVPGANPAPGRKTGSTKYKMQAAQLAQEAAKIAAQQEAQAKEQREAAARGESQTEDTVRGLWKSRVLASYKGKGAKDSHTLLAKISVPDSGRAQLEVGDRQIAANLQEEMINTVDKMFDVFQNCAYEFNKIAAGTELEIHWIRPFLSREVSKDWHNQEIENLIFSGRVSTRRWTMVIKGTVEEIIVFILPADKLIGFALSAANHFKPYYVMQPISENLDVHWQVEEHVIPQELFPGIYKELFDGLIRFAREEAHPDEVFTLKRIGIVPANETAESLIEEDQKRQKLYQDQFFEDMRHVHDFQPNGARAASQPPTPPSQSAPQPVQPPVQQQPVMPQRPQTPSPPQPFSQQTPQSFGQQAQPAPSTDSGVWKQVPDVNFHNPENARLIAERAAGILRQHQQQNALNQAAAQQNQMPPQPVPQQPVQQQHLQQPQTQPHPQQQQSPAQQYAQQPNQMQPNQMHSMQQNAAQNMQQHPQQHQHPQQQHPQQQHPQQQHPQQMQQPMQQSAHQQGNMPDMQPQWPALGPQGQQAPQPQQAPQQITAPAPQRPAAPPQPVRPATFPEALGALLATLDAELESVAKAGSDAFAQRDLARADAALKFSGRLNEFRTLARELFEYYGGGK
ncbi:MAG TPA: hypothetical protein V6C76_08015 [Drouetiella sp.]